MREHALGYMTPRDHDRQLDRKYAIERLAATDRADRAAVIDLWTREGAMARPVAEARVSEVEFVAIDERDGVVGVSTVYLQRDPLLRIELWHYRTFVARAHRESDLAMLLLYRTRDDLQERFVNGTDTRAAGIIFYLQNEVLKRVRNEAIWSTSRFAFVGEDERGAHRRVYYFPGAILRDF